MIDFTQLNAIIQMLVAIFSVLIVIYRQYRNRRESQDKETHLEQGITRLEEQAKHEKSLIDSASSILEAAANRQSILLVKSEGRLQTLYTLGTLLIILSVIVPFIIISMYFSHDPFDQLQKWIEMKLDPKDVIDIARRDWHLLAVGVSFGLMYLAVARGVFTAESKQRETYFLLSRKVSYYGDLVRVLQLADKLGAEPNEEQNHVRTDAVRHVITQLLESPKAYSKRDEALVTGEIGKDDGLIKTVADMVKRSSKE